MSKLTKIVCLIALAGACTVDDPCDEGQVLDERNFACVSAPADAGAPPSDVGPTSSDAGSGPADASVGDAATLDAAAPADMGSADAGSTFGAPCQSSDECTGDTSFCAVNPGSPSGFCTITGCLEPGVGCPTGFRCMDISMLAPTLGSLCVPE